MREQHNGAVTWFQFDSLRDLGGLVSHGVFARHGGVSQEPFATLNAGPTTDDKPAARRENYARIAATLPGAPLLVGTTPLQGSTLVEVVPELLAGAEAPADILAGGCDAFITRMRGIAVFWAVADCATILLVDPVHEVIGLAHAGWRGTRDAIAVKTIEAMAGAYETRPADLRAAIGPTIGPCCYEVDERVRSAFAASPSPVARETASFSTRELRAPDGSARSSLRLDLVASNRAQLIAAGVPQGQIEEAGLCTGCRTDLFYSHRMEHGHTGRFAVALGLLA